MRVQFIAAICALATASVADAAETQRVWTSRATGQRPRVFVIIGEPPAGVIILALAREYQLQWTANGQQMPPNLTGISECYYDIANRYSCEALRRWFGDVPPRVGRTPVTGSAPEAFLLKNMEFDTEYCFRFKYQVTDWLEWSCTHTGVAPPRPAAPGQPALTALPAASGQGVPGGDVPFRLLVEWKDDPSNLNLEHDQAVQILDQGTWRKAADANSGSEATIAFPAGADPDAVYSVRVCASNISGETCSPIARTAGRAWLEKAPAGGNATRFPTQQASDTFDPSTPSATATTTTVRAQGRVRVDGAAASGPSRSKCELAQVARARNSPAAPGLEAACVQETRVNGLAERGEVLAEQDPLAAALRDRQPDDSARRGFYIGMGAAEGQTLPGPGKQAIHDGLPIAEQSGFATAVAFSLERNRNGPLAAAGAQLATEDQAVGSARNANADPFYRLGFDIGMGFGATGGSNLDPQTIRTGLGDVTRHGFDDAILFHSKGR